MNEGIEAGAALNIGKVNTFPGNQFIELIVFSSVLQDKIT
jgi:hypothetical protein